MARFFSSRAWNVAGRAALCAVLVCLPALLLEECVWLLFRAHIRDFVPTIGDTLYYWHQVATMKTAAFHGGYYSLEEVIAPSARLGIGSFGPHSIWFFIPHALMAAAFGWQLWSGVVDHVVFVTAALALYAVLTRPKAGTSVFLIGFLGTFVVFYQYLATFYQEGIHYALAILMAGLFVRLRQRPGTWVRWALFCVITYASLIRYDWSPLYVPYFWLTTDEGARLRWPRILLKSAGGFFFVYAGYMIFRDPYMYESLPGSFSGFELYMRALQGDFSLLWHHYAMNYKMFFENYVGDPTDKLLTLNILFLYLAFCAVRLAAKWRGTDPGPAFDRFAFQLHTWNVGAMILLNFSYKYLWGEGTRLLLPHFLLSVFFFARGVRLPQAAVVLALNLLVLPLSLGSFRSLGAADYVHGQGLARGLAQTEAVLRPVLVFDPASPGWRNTLLLAGFDYDLSLLAVPPGIALSSLRIEPHAAKIFPARERAPGQPFRARYIAIRDPDVLALVRRVNTLRLLVAAPFGDIYENLGPVADASSAAPRLDPAAGVSY